MKNVHVNVREALKAVQGAHGLTQSELADKVGLSQSAVSKILAGKQKTVNHVAYIRILSLLEPGQSKVEVIDSN